MKLFNIKGIIVLIIILVIFQIAFGFFISPGLGQAIINKVNEHQGTKIYVDKVNIWPLTLSISLENLRVYDPDKEDETILKIGKASARLGIIALLSKRLEVSHLSLNGVDITVKRDADGNFNLQKMTQSEEERKPARHPLAMFRRIKPKEDWFGKFYDLLKLASSKKAVDTQLQERKDEKEVRRDVTELPKGREVKFKTIRDDYILEIKKLDINNALMRLEVSKGQSIDVDKTMIKIRGIAIDPEKGARFDAARVKGVLKKEGRKAGEFDLHYEKSFDRDDNLITEINVRASDVNLVVIKFVYEDSLPVEIEKGTLDLRSETRLVNNVIDSKNRIELTNQVIAPKGGKEIYVKFVSIETVCDVLNDIDPIRLRFTITGTIEHPKFGGFIESLFALLKPNLKEVTKTIEKEGISFLDKWLSKKEGEEDEGEGSSFKDTLRSFLGGSDEEVQNP